MGLADVDRTLPINRLVFEARRDVPLSQRFRTDLEALMEEYGLSDKEKDALRNVDIERLAELGMHPYFLPQITRLFYGTGHNHNRSDASRAYAKHIVSMRRKAGMPIDENLRGIAR